MASIIDTSDFDRDLNNYINNLLPKGLEKGLGIACVAVESQAKRNCPVDDGILRASITHEVKGKEGFVGSGVEYAAYVHQGTGIYAKKGDGRQTPWTYMDAEGKFHRTVGQQPQPFLQDAIDELRDNISDLIKEGLK